VINTHFHQRRLTLISVLHLFLIFRTRKRQRVRPESDYALKNEIEIERLKFDQSEQKEPKLLYPHW